MTDRIIEMDLPVGLTDDEIRQCGEELADTMKQIEDIGSALKAEQERVKIARKPLEKRIVDLARLIRRKVEDRPVECTETLNPKLKAARITRNDTGEVVSTRPLKPSELQVELPEAPKRPSRPGVPS